MGLRQTQGPLQGSSAGPWVSQVALWAKCRERGEG